MKILVKHFFTILITVLFLIVGAIGMINIMGGFSISSNSLNKIELFKENLPEIKEIKVKFGINVKTVIQGFVFKNEKIEIEAETLEFSQSFFSFLFNKNNKITEINLQSATVKIEIAENEDILNGILHLEEEFKVSQFSLFNLENIKFVLKKPKTEFVIENLTGAFENEKNEKRFKGDFKIASTKYLLEFSNNKQNNILDFKLESENISLKTNLLSNKGKIMFSVNNLTQFLNDITPDTININLNAIDGKKNTIYFESEIFYNEVKKAIEFEASKVQLFSGKEEKVEIETLANNTYKIKANIEEIILNKTEDIQNLAINDSKIPAIPFSFFNASSVILFEVNIANINLKSTQKVDNIQNILLNGEAKNKNITFNFNFNYNKNIQVSAYGFIENFESEIRKGIINTAINFSAFDFSNFLLTENINLSFGKEENANLSFEYIITGSYATVNNAKIVFENSVLNFELEYNLYNKNSYIASIFAENLNFKNINFKIADEFKKTGGDLFRILFDYLKFKEFIYISFICKNCKAGEDTFDTNLKFNLSQGKIELESLILEGEKISLFSSGLLDIRNPQNNVANLNINIKKWDDFSFNKIFSLPSIFEKFSDFKVPSLAGFSGYISINGKNISTKFNKVKNLTLYAPLNYGTFKISEKTGIANLILNETENNNFLKLEANFFGNTPEVFGSLKIANYEIKELLQTLLNKKVESVSGYASLGLGFNLKGFLLLDLMKNSNLNIQLQSKLLIKNFNVEEVIDTLSNPNISFKKLTNNEIIAKSNKTGVYDVSSLIKFANNEFVMESLELKTPRSTSIFVGKILLPFSKNSLQMVGKTAIIGANLNNNLKGVMPIYFTSSISNPEEEIEVNFDYSQVNKYSEARRVLYK